MAFNESQNQALINTGLSGASRGQDGDDSYGKLFAGLGKTMDNTLTGFDQSLQTKIEMDASAAVEGVVNETTPPELASGEQDLNSLKNARAQGVLSDVEFYTRLTAKVKNMKAAVPEGYRPIVDRMVSSALGSSTANDLRKAKLAEIDSALSSGDAQSKMEQAYINQNGETWANQTVMAAYEKKTGRPLANDIATGQYDFQMLRLLVSSKQAQDAGVKQAAAELSLDSTLQTRQINTVAGKVLGEVFNATVTNSPYGKVIAQMAAAESASSPGGKTWTDEEKTAIRTTWANFKVGIEQSYYDMMGTPEFAGVDAGAKEGVKKQLDQRVASIESMLTDENFGRLNAVKNELADSMSQSKAELYRQYPEMRLYELAKSAQMPDTVIERLALRDPTIVDKHSQALYRTVTQAAVYGDESIEQLWQKSEGDVKDMSQVVKGTVGYLQRILNSSEITEEQLPAIAMKIFAEKNTNMLRKLEANDRIGVFRSFVTPNVVNKLSQDPAAFETMSNWANDQFVAIAKNAYDTVVEGQQNRLSLDIAWDGKQFAIQGRDQSFTEGVTSIPNPFEWRAVSSTNKAVGDINSYIQTMEPVWKKQGLSIEAAMQATFATDDFNKMKKNGTLLMQMFESFKGSAGSDELKGGRGKDLISFSRPKETPEDTGTVSGDVQNVVAKGLPKWEQFGDLASVDGFVIHHTGGRGGVDGVMQTFKERGYPAHYVIDRQGRIFQTLADGKQGRQIKKSGDGLLSNANTIGVEVIAKDDSDVTPEQAEAAARLYEQLQQKYGIDANKVFAHGEINSHKQRTEGTTITNFLKEKYGKKKQMASQ